MNKPVKIYTLSTCSHCRAAKRFLDDCQVQYEFEDVDLLQGEERKAAIEAVRKLNPTCSFPTIIINKKIIVGFKKNKIQKTLNI
ncbi:MAG: glutaredoxin family protein [Desulfatiglandaceae bacterium]